MWETDLYFRLDKQDCANSYQYNSSLVIGCYIHQSKDDNDDGFNENKNYNDGSYGNPKKYPEASERSS